MSDEALESIIKSCDLMEKAGLTTYPLAMCEMRILVHAIQELQGEVKDLQARLRVS